MVHTLKRLPDLWFVGAALVVILSLGCFVGGPLTGDDDYVIHNLASPSVRDILFAYNVDLVKGEGGGTTWYEGFSALQRRYVRIVPSALMAVEYRTFGSHPIALKSVSLLVHLLNLFLAYRLLRRYMTDPRTAALVVTLVGLHPAAAECVGWFACQPILFAALASLFAVERLLRLRQKVTAGRRTAFVVASTGALFSYEAAVAVPLLLVGLDWFWPRAGEERRPTDRWATASIVAAYPLYLLIAWWNRAGTTLTDASYRAGVVELAGNVRVDLANYLVKILPMPPYGPDVYVAIGSWAGAAVIAVAVAFWLVWMGSSRARTLGLLAFVFTLAPSLLTRAAVSVLNFPTFRQMYFPVAGVGLLLCAWRPAGFRRVASSVAGCVVLALFVLYQAVGPTLARTDDRTAHQVAGGRLDAIVDGADPLVPIVQIGDSTCGYSLDFNARGREVWKLIPPATSGRVPLLRFVDDRTVEVRAPDGDSLAIVASVPPEVRPRRVRTIPSLLTTGWQRVGIATAHTPQRAGDAVSGFRLTFDRPLGAHVLITVSGCVELGRWQASAAPR